MAEPGSRHHKINDLDQSQKLPKILVSVSSAGLGLRLRGLPLLVRSLYAQHNEAANGVAFAADAALIHPVRNRLALVLVHQEVDADVPAFAFGRLGHAEKLHNIRHLLKTRIAPVDLFHKAT